MSQRNCWCYRGRRDVAAENLDTVVPSVGNVGPVYPVLCESTGPVELTVPGSAYSPFGKKSSRRIEFLNTVVARVAHIDVTIKSAVAYDGWEIKLSISRTSASPLGHVGQG
jgi:hypothetical protein